MRDALWTVLISFLDKPELLLLKSKVLKAQWTEARGCGLTVQHHCWALLGTYPAPDSSQNPGAGGRGMDNPGRIGRGVCIGPRSPGEGITISRVLFSILLEPRGSQRSACHCFPSHPVCPGFPILPWETQTGQFFLCFALIMSTSGLYCHIEKGSCSPAAGRFEVPVQRCHQDSGKAAAAKDGAALQYGIPEEGAGCSLAGV